MLTSMDNSVLSDDAELRRVRLDDLELHRAHAAANEESVSLADGAVG